jgi:hypothetical protein
MTIFMPPEFITGKSMGTELPTRCLMCKNFIDCRFSLDSLWFKDYAENEAALGGGENN